MRTLFFVLFILLSLPAISQKDSTDSRFKLGISLNNSFNFPVAVYSLSPLLTLQNRKHQFEIGPRLFFFEQYGSEIHRGVVFNYRYYTTGNDKKFGVFLFAHSDYIYSFYETFDTGHFSSPPYVVTYNTRDITNAITTNLGFGVQVNVFKGLYFASNFGLGVRFMHYQYLLDSYNTIKTSEGWRRDLSIMAGVNLGYRF